MELHITSEERAQLELIAIHTGKTASQVVTEAARFLLHHDIDAWSWMERRERGDAGPENTAFLSDEQLEARVGRALRR